MPLTLARLIEALAGIEPKKVLSPGFHVPHQHSNIPKEIAFRPQNSNAAEKMLFHARSALGMAFEKRWDAAVFKADESTLCHISDRNKPDQAKTPITEEMIASWILQTPGETNETHTTDTLPTV